MILFWFSLVIEDMTILNIRIIKRLYKLLSLLAISGCLLALYSMSYATTSSTSLAPITNAPSGSYVLGSGSGHVSDWGTGLIGQTSPTMGICKPPATAKVTWGLIGIDGAGGGCYDKWMQSSVTANVAGTAPNQYYTVTLWGVVNTNSGCSDVGITVAWVLQCTQ